ncbi:hypothetical protein KCU73_g902, partial [Aureobasidium melanogenum]
MHPRQLVRRVVDTQANEAKVPWFSENAKTEKIIEIPFQPQRNLERQRLLHAFSPQQGDQYKRHGMSSAVNQPGRMLLASEASVNARDETQDMSLSGASARGHEKIVLLLLEGGDNPNAKNKIYGTPLQAALAKGHKEIVQMLLDYGADVTAEDETHGTPLQVASAKGHKEIIQLLLDCGADVNAMDKIHGTPLQVASAKGHKEIVQLLLDHGADANAEDETHGTPLHMASIEGHKEIVQLLLDYGADNSVGSQERVVDFPRNHSGEPRSGIHGSRRGHTRTTFSIDHTA